MPLCGPKQVIEPPDAALLTANDCRAHLDAWRESAPGTRYHAWAVLSGFFKWLYRADLIAEESDGADRAARGDRRLKILTS